MTKNPEITILEDEVSSLEKEIDELYRKIGAICNECDHERTTYALSNPWWCGKCGGEMPELNPND